MKAVVSEDCIGCGMCPTICPEVFKMGDDDMAHTYVDVVPEDAIEKAREAAESCPVSAISLEE